MLEFSQFMLRALELAAKGKGAVEPNPMVGALVIHNHAIVSEAYHRQYGSAHAERLAIEQIPANIPRNECLLLVTLEPCAHYGKTPPCADFIIQSNIPRVIIASEDPNPLVRGKGIQKLLSAGIEVRCGLLETQARQLNASFYSMHAQKRPFVTLKWAESADGFMASVNAHLQPQKVKITGPKTDQWVHQLRARHQAILVGKKTVLTDNPQLTVRLAEGFNPLRLIWATELQPSPELFIFNNAAKTHLLLNGTGHSDAHKTFLNTFNPSVKDLLEVIYQLNIHSVLVEGGKRVLESFIKERCYDRIVKLVNTQLYLGKGVRAPEFNTSSPSFILGQDRIFDVKI